MFGTLIKSIISGGQSGADRAALDTAKKHNIPIGGWCPKGGWAEDMTESPGLLYYYPELKETPSSDPKQRTEWNLRDCDVALTFCPDKMDSLGTTYGLNCLNLKNKLSIVVQNQTPIEIYSLLKSYGENLIISVGGPRESEYPGIYNEVYGFMEELIKLDK